MTQDLSAAPTPARPPETWRAAVDLERLQQWMDAQGLGEGGISAPQVLTGGTQNILLRFTRAGRDFVLRRPPLHLRPNNNETMRREARVLGALADTDVPHPRLFAACDDTSILGAAFYLMEPIDGFSAVNGLPPLHASDPAVRHRMGLSMVESAARLGKVDFVSKGLSDYGRLDGYLERQAGRWQKQLDSYAQYAGWPGADALSDVRVLAPWLEAHRPRAMVPGIIHGDFQIHNCMFRRDSGDVAAIIDWEMATLGDPLLDLGWMLATWPQPDGSGQGKMPVMPWVGFPTREELVTHYGRYSGRDMSDIEWYAVLACFKLAIVLEGTYARACAGQVPKQLGDNLHAAAIRLLAKAVTWIDGAGLSAATGSSA
ncbi:MAG: phosphotransferase family protein [Janthinobacterium lividum]